MKSGSLKKTYRRGMLVSAALVMATVLVLCAPMAEAKKRHLHVVRCPTEADGVSCIGTTRNDHLIGRAGLFDFIQGKEGNDVYEGNGGYDFGDHLIDESTTSSDRYVFKDITFGDSSVDDCGGGSDTVDLSSTSFRLLDNVTITRDDFVDAACDGGLGADDLRLIGPEGIVLIVDHYGTHKVETIKFANGTLTF